MFKCILFNELHVFVPSVRIGCALWLLCGGAWVHLWIWNPHERRSAPEHESLPHSDSPEPPESEASLRDRWKHYTATEEQLYLRITGGILNGKNKRIVSVRSDQWAAALLWHHTACERDTELLLILSISAISALNITSNKKHPFNEKAWQMMKIDSEEHNERWV